MFSLISRRSILSRLPTVLLMFRTHGLDHLLTAEHQELAGEGRGTVPGLFDLFETAAVGGREISTLEQQIAVAVDHGQQVIEVVGHAAGEQSDRFQFLGLLQELFGAGQGILRRLPFRTRRD